MTQAISPADVEAINSRFFALANWRPAAMESSTGTFKQAGTTTFTLDPTGGYAKGIWVMGTVDINVTLNSGTVATSPFAPYNLFDRVRVKLGNPIHDCRPFAFGLVYNQSNNAGQDFFYSGPNPESWAENVLFGSNNGTTKSWGFQSAAGDNVWNFAFYIPLQFEPNDPNGLLPLGSSANKLTVELVGCVNPIGTDPLINPIVITSGSPTATIGTTNNSLSCVVEYADMNSLSGTQAGGIVVPQPIITAGIYLRDNVTPYPSFGKYLYAYMEEPYLFQRLIAVMNDNFSYNNATYPGAASQNSYLTGIKLNYDGQNTAREWGPTTGGTNPFFLNYLRTYGNLPAQGIIPFDFASGNDPRHPNGQDLLNAEQFTQARIGIQYNNPNGGGAAPNGAYVHLIGQYIVPQAY